jgi:hypothetical protein
MPLGDRNPEIFALMLKRRALEALGRDLSAAGEQLI